ncbi:hypothetical protein ACFL59_08195 [Planctomycetota bacterium]
MNKSCVVLSFVLVLAVLALSHEPALAQAALDVQKGGEDRDVLEGGKFAGQEKLTLPGVFLGGGLTVLDPESGTARTFTRLRLRSEFAIWQLAVGVKLNLAFDDDFNLRSEDWDEPSDWPGFIDYLEFGRPEELVYVRMGRLQNVRLGHGTLLNHYQSAIDLDSQKVGLQAGLHLDSLGVDLLTSNVIEWEVIGGRAYVAPFGEAGGIILPDIRFTGQFVVDTLAPVVLFTDPFGQPLLDDDENFTFRGDPLVTFGLGAEVQLLKSPVSLVPYLEQNFISGKGSGTHAGAELRFTLPVFGKIGLVAQGEFRILDHHYLPSYFDAQYEIDRYRFPEKNSQETKRAYLDQVVAQTGYMFRAGVRVPFVEASLGFDGLTELEEQNRLVVGVEVSGLPYLRLRILYTRRGVHTADEILTYDDQTTLVGEVLVQLNRFVFLDLEYSRTFELDETTRTYRPIDAYTPAVLIGWTF